MKTPGQNRGVPPKISVLDFLMGGVVGFFLGAGAQCVVPPPVDAAELSPGGVHTQSVRCAPIGDFETIMREMGYKHVFPGTNPISLLPSNVWMSANRIALSHWSGDGHECLIYEHTSEQPWRLK